MKIKCVVYTLFLYGISFFVINLWSSDEPIVFVDRPVKECSACSCRSCSYISGVYTCECQTCFGAWRTASIPIDFKDMNADREVHLIALDGMLAYIQPEKDRCWHSWADGFPIKYCGDVCSVDSGWQGDAFIKGYNAWYAGYLWVTTINGIEHKYVNGKWEPTVPTIITKSEKHHQVLFERERDRGF
jgi:hypothetical protein